MKSAQATKKIQAAALAKRIEEEQARQRLEKVRQREEQKREQERRRVELEKQQRRQAVSRRKKELAIKAAKHVDTIVDSLWLAAGEGHYQLWVGRLNKVERDLLTARGLSIRTILEESEKLGQEHKKTWGNVLVSDSLVSNTYIADKNTFLRWFASQMGLEYLAEIDEVIENYDFRSLYEFRERIGLFDLITLELGLRQAHTVSESDIFESASYVTAFLQKISYVERPTLNLTLFLTHLAIRDKATASGSLLRATNINVDLLREHLSPLASSDVVIRELVAKDHSLMRGVKKQCLKWCDHYLVNEGVRENGWVVSWWDSIFSDIQEESRLSHQLAWLSSKDVQAALEEVERKTEEAASLEQCQVTIAFDDNFGTAALFASLVGQYFNRLGYQCEMLQKPDEICISWAMAAG